MLEKYEVRGIPSYTKENTWAKVMADGSVKVGITDYAQQMLNDIVFVDIHEEGSDVTHMQPFATAESSKAVSDVYSPVSGTIKEINEEAIDDPGVINRDPYDAGWLVTIEPTNLDEEMNNLLSADEYKKLIAGI
ncbi:MAG: glycine cleavage system protein GcvH [Eubacteriaceae bacterium]